MDFYERFAYIVGTFVIFSGGCGIASIVFAWALDKVITALKCKQAVLGYWWSKKVKRERIVDGRREE